MPHIPETIGQKPLSFDAPDQSLRANRIDLLKSFTRLFKDDGCPEDKVIDDFMRDFEHTKLLNEVLGDMPEAKRKEVLRGAARCHVASFGRGRDFLAVRNQLHLVGQDCVTLFGTLPASLRQTMLAHAYVGDRGQIVLESPDVGLSIPLGRTLLGNGDGALTTHEVRELLMFPENACHWRLEIFSAKLRHFSEGALDAESCHVWVDLIDRYIDGKPIVEFSEDKAVLEALAYTLKKLAERASVLERREEFPISRMLTNSAEAYFLAQDHPACGAALLTLATFHARKLESDLAAGASTLAASVLARDALQRWEDGRYGSAIGSYGMAMGAYTGSGVLQGIRSAPLASTLAASVLARDALQRWEDGRYGSAIGSYGMAMGAYTGSGVLQGIRSAPLAPRSGVVDEIVPLPTLVEHTSQSDFEAAWDGRWETTKGARSQSVLDLRVLEIERRFAKLTAKPSESNTSN